MKKTNKKTVVIVVAIVLVLAAAFAIVYTQFGPKTTQGGKQITVKVVLEDESVQEYPIATDAEYLGQALKKQNLIEGEEGAFGLYITAVAGVTADDSKQQWWCITKNGESVTTGVDQTPIENGETYELTLTTGY